MSTGNSISRPRNSQSLSLSLTIQLGKVSVHINLDWLLVVKFISNRYALHGAEERIEAFRQHLKSHCPNSRMSKSVLSEHDGQSFYTRNSQSFPSVIFANQMGT